MILNQGQQAVMSSALKFLLSQSERMMVIKGPAGTGKSTLTKELYPKLVQYSKVIATILGQPAGEEAPILLTATTNAAAANLADITGQEVVTIHSLLGLTIQKDYSTGETNLIRRNKDVIKSSIIIIDEAFNTDDLLLKYVNDCTHQCKIIWIGDPYQCAPVRYVKSPVDDLQCRTEELTQVMRNQGIITDIGLHWRTSVINNQFGKFLHADCPEILYTNGAEFQALIDQEFADPTADENKNKILCWTNKQSINYSSYVRSLRKLPPEFTEGEYVQVGNAVMSQKLQTDEIIRIRDFHAQATICGVPGRYASIYKRSDHVFVADTNQHVMQALASAKAAKNWRLFYDIQDNVPDLRAVHGSTIHKAQGRTYENVFIDLNDTGRCNIASDLARMMHVAVTRPSKRIIFRGSLPAKYGG